MGDRIRPVPGGVQIAFGGFLCTIGFGATRSGVVGYVTNFHCTKNPWSGITRSSELGALTVV